MSGKRVETVTVMFTDVAGSTALRERVGEDEAERLRLGHDTIVHGTVEEHAGTVVKHLGDGAMAVFASAASAIDAAVTIQQELDRFNRERRGEPVLVRIGISAGDVTVDGGDYFGLPVVEAQRLEASADPATIRCAGLVRQLGRGRGEHAFVELGELALKGLAEPLDAFEVSWQPLDDSRSVRGPLLPPVLALAGGMPFSGRGEALGGLAELAKRAGGGGFALALLAGEPGIGKTRLAHELATRVTAEGWSVLGGRCDEEIIAPFQAFRIALQWCIDHVTGGDVEMLGSYPGELARLVPDLSARVGDDVSPPLDLDPDAERYRLMQAVESWLETLAARHPLLLVLDDVHWADRATLMLLQHLVRAAPEHVLIVATYRDTDVDRSHPLSSVLADLRRLPGVERIVLSGLPLDEVREFLERAGGHDLDEHGEAFAELLVRETAGNPFFVSEMLRHFAESGLLIRRDGRWSGDIQMGTAHVPEGIREVVGRRLGRLGEAAEEVLRAASVVGYEFGVEVVAEVTGRSVDEVIEELDRAAAANIVIEVDVGRFRFSHALVRETLYDELSSTRRVRQHRKVALALESLYGDDDDVIAELAAHWREASVGGDPSRAVELAIRAGELAMASSAPDTAVVSFRDAVEMLDEDDAFEPDRRRALVRLAEAQIRSGDPSHRSTAATAAESALADGDVETAVAALTLHWRSSFSEFDEADERKIEMLRTALRQLDLDDVQRADLTGELATELIFTRDVEGRREAMAAFERLIASMESEVRAALVTSSYGRTSSAPGSINEFLQEAAEWSAGRRTATRGVPIAVMAPLMAGDRARFETAFEQAIGLLDDPFSQAQSVVWRVPILVAEADLDGAQRLADELLTSMRELQLPEWRVYRATTSLGMARERGELPSVRRFWEPLLGSVHPSSASSAAIAFLRLADGDPDGASAVLDAFDLDDVADDAGYPMAVGLITEVIAAIGSDGDPEAAYELLAPGAGRHLFTGGIILGPVNRLLGLLLDRLGEHERAEASLRAAVADSAAVELPTWTARTNLDLAESLLRRERVTEARDALDAARISLDGRVLPASTHRLGELTDQLATRR